MNDFISRLFDAMNFYTLVFSFATFLLGLFLNHLIPDRLYRFFNKEKIKQRIVEKGTPQVYTTAIKTTVDLENLRTRLDISAMILLGETVIKGDNKNEFEINLRIINHEEIKPLQKTMRLIEIENCTNQSCGVCEILDFSKNKLKFISPNLSFIEKNTSIILITNEYQKPACIFLDYCGQKLKYVISEHEGSIQCKV